MVRLRIKRGIKMIAKFKIELGDVIAVQSFLATKSKFHKRNKIIVSIVVVILLLLVNLMIFKANWIFVAILSIALFLTTYNFIYKKSMIDQAKRLVKTNPSLINRECILTVSKDGLMREMKNTTEKIKWDEVKLVSEDDERYILYMSDIHAIVLNKNPYNMSDEETKEYNSLLHNYFNQHNIEIE